MILSQCQLHDQPTHEKKFSTDATTANRKDSFPQWSTYTQVQCNLNYWPDTKI